LQRIVGFLVATSAMLLLAVGMAYAVTKVCDKTTCKGTDNRDVLTGTQIDNIFYGKAKGDTITDNVAINHDHDVVYANRGSDVINVREGNQNPQDFDTVRCGLGTDTVYFDKTDVLIGGCERKFSG
jgi:hypothetical protein